MTADVENSKAAVLHHRQLEWQEEWHRANELAHPELYDRRRGIKPPAPVAPDLSPSGWITVRWPGGHIVMDAEAFSKLSKAKQNKIMKLGGRKPC